MTLKLSLFVIPASLVSLTTFINHHSMSMDNLFMAKLPKTLTTASKNVAQFLQTNMMEDAAEKMPPKLWTLIHSFYCFISRLHPREVEDSALLVRDCRIGESCELASQKPTFWIFNNVIIVLYGNYNCERNQTAGKKIRWSGCSVTQDVSNRGNRCFRRVKSMKFFSHHSKPRGTIYIYI